MEGLKRRQRKRYFKMQMYQRGEGWGLEIAELRDHSPLQKPHLQPWAVKDVTSCFPTKDFFSHVRSHIHVNTATFNQEEGDGYIRINLIVPSKSCGSFRLNLHLVLPPDGLFLPWICLWPLFSRMHSLWLGL